MNVQTVRTYKVDVGGAMSNTHIFIDYENIQPHDLGLVNATAHTLRIFLGPTQTKLPLAMVSALQPFGARAEYLQMETGGHNALDFYISFTLGVVTAQYAGDSFAIVSKDSGFDPMVKLLRKKGIDVRRVVSVADAVQADNRNHLQIAT